MLLYKQVVKIQIKTINHEQSSCGQVEYKLAMGKNFWSLSYTFLRKQCSTNIGFHHLCPKNESSKISLTGGQHPYSPH